MSEISFNAIPSVQRAFVLPTLGVPLKLINDHPVVAPTDLLPGQCLVKLTHSGVCHSDFAIKEGWFAQKTRPKPNLIGGHEGIGTVVAIGEHTHNSPVKIGDRVGITFLANTCRNCEHCLDGDESYCTQLKRFGSTVDGTFCEFTVASIDFVVPIPDALTDAEAAPLMCAGFTVYNALQQCDARIGNWVVIPGAGGGLGHLAIQYAAAMGLRVVAIDSGEDKRKLVLELGAEKWIDYKESKDLVSDIIAATEGGAHAAVITTGSTVVYNQAVGYLRNRATLVAVGLPKDGVISVPLVLLASRGITVRGILLGNRQSVKEAVQLAAISKVKCRYTLRGLSELEQVYEEMEENKIVGRIVLDISK
ncbi:ADH1_3 [Sanghuangporus weigelae]